MKNLYSAEAQERRDKFNQIIGGIDMVLMNNIAEVDQSIWENWKGKSPLGSGECEDYEGEDEVYQWYAINQSDADFLAKRNQYITYSDTLDTYFLAITHFGTPWDCVGSMVSDILGEME